MIRWIKIVWHVVRVPVMVLAGMASVIALLAGFGLVCVEVFGPTTYQGLPVSHWKSVFDYVLRGVFGLMGLRVVAVIVGAWWHAAGAVSLKEAREKYPAPPKVSSEPGDLEVVSAGDLEVLQ